MTFKIPYVNFKAQYEAEKEDLARITDEVFASGWLIGGEQVEALEEELATYCGVKHVVALNSGTDALILGMKALGIGPGDEVITPPNSFVASTAAIVALGAAPVFADVGDGINIDPVKVKEAVTPRTKAIMPVHLSGRIADMDAINRIAKDHGLFVIEDAAQSIGSTYKGKKSGNLGTIGCFSAHPLKNLNAAGDAGFLTTNNDDVANRVRLLRNHGLKDRNTVVKWGTVSRLDSLQAAILRYRLSNLESAIRARRTNAQRYRDTLNGQGLELPLGKDHEFNTFHTFIIHADRRDELQAYLLEQGVETAIHYPIPIHLQPAAKDLGYAEGDFPVCEAQAKRILSLPIHQYLSRSDVEYVAEAVNRFFD